MRDPHHFVVSYRQAGCKRCGQERDAEIHSHEAILRALQRLHRHEGTTSRAPEVRCDCCEGPAGGRPATSADGEATVCGTCADDLTSRAKGER
jgi:hypothetical protein